MSLSKLSPAIFITNDDGISPDSALILPLAQRLAADGHDVVLCAPGRNNSACGMRLTLSAPNVLRRHPDLEARFAVDGDLDDLFPVSDGARGRNGSSASTSSISSNSSTGSGVGADGNGAVNSEPAQTPGKLYVFSVDRGTPCDCVIIGIEPGQGLMARLGKRPALVVSGVNVGQNLGTDVLYSGTFSAARQASIYGIPSVALSLNLYTRNPYALKHRIALRNALAASSAFVKRALDALPHKLPDPGRFTVPYSIPEISEDPPYSVARDPAQSTQRRLEDAFSRGDFAFNVNIPTDWDGRFAACSLDSILYRSIIDVEYVPSGIPGARDETALLTFSGKRNDQLHAPGSDVETLLKTRAASVCPVSTWPLSHPLALPERFFADTIREESSFWDLTVPKHTIPSQKL